MATYPRDQFDVTPSDLTRIGAHRGPRARGHGWILFAWAALATGVIVVAGLYGLSRVTDGVTLPFAAGSSTAVSTPAPGATFAPVTDPSAIAARKISVTVLNGTTDTGASTSATDILTSKKWTVAGTAPASSTDVARTFVYYADKKNEDVAAGVALSLGLPADRARQSDNFQGAPITAVLGKDFKA